MNTATKLPEAKAPRVKPVSGYQTTDGMLFAHRPDAERHQNRMDFFEWCSRNDIGASQDECERIAESIWNNFNITAKEGAE